MPLFIKRQIEILFANHLDTICQPQFLACQSFDFDAWRFLQTYFEYYIFTLRKHPDVKEKLTMIQLFFQRPRLTGSGFIIASFLILAVPTLESCVKRNFNANSSEENPESNDDGSSDGADIQSASNSSKSGVVYFCQWDNKFKPSETCNNSSFAMVLRQLGYTSIVKDGKKIPSDATRNLTPDDLFEHFGEMNSMDELKQAAKNMGLGTEVNMTTKTDWVKEHLKKGHFVIAGADFVGKRGHMILVYKDSGDSAMVNDPAGKCTHKENLKKLDLLRKSLFKNSTATLCFSTAHTLGLA